jgi:hypothetical protein
VNSEPVKVYKLDLTDSEWLSLLDGGDASELGICCANISALRDELFFIVRQGRHEELPNWTLDDLRQKLKWVADGHDLTPTLKKLCVQLDLDPDTAKHTKRSMEFAGVHRDAKPKKESTQEHES